MVHTEGKLSPVSWIGIGRFTPCSVTVSALPKIDLMILSHDHYDHLDYKVMKEISAKVKRVIVPLGVEEHLRKWKSKRKDSSRSRSTPRSNT